MSVFDDVSMEWSGKPYRIPAKKVLGAIAVVEEVITLAELARYSDRRTAPMAKIAAAYGALLRYAGAEISDEDVYAGMFASGAATDMVSALGSLVALMTPPASMRSAATGDSPQGN